MEINTEKGSEDKQPEDKVVGVNCEQKLGDFCLVCFSKVDRSKLPKQSSLLSSNLNVIFLLKNVLQIPSELLIGNFRKCGSPAYWISLCEHCSQLTGQAMERHLQILTLVNQLRSILKIITGKIRDSSVPSEILASYQDTAADNKKKSMQEKRFQILKRTREYVINYDYNTHLVNPFIEGDRRAKELDEMDESCSSEDSEVEEEEEEEEDFIEYKKVNGMWKCGLCEKFFKGKRNLRNHAEGQHPKVPGQFKCNICEKGINSRYYLKLHLRKFHKLNGNQIESDVKKSLEKPSPVYYSIWNLDQIDGKWKCRHCGKEYNSKQSVWTHERENHPSVPGQFKCDICGMTKNSRIGLVQHLRNAHKVNSKGEPIKVKPKDYSREKKRRAKLQKPKAPQTCHLCGKSIGGTDALKKHLKYFHDKNFDIRCHVCGMGMWGTQMLKLHLLRKHTDDPLTKKLVEEGAKLWKCGVVGCSGTYLKESGLEEHMKKVHGGENGDQEINKRFTCAFCGKSFWYWRTLKVHETSHMLGKEKPYSCDLCEARFKFKPSIKKHKKRFHSEILL